MLTHSLAPKVQYLHHADHIVVMSGGEVKAQGTFRELSEQNQFPKTHLKPREKAQTETKDHPNSVPVDEAYDANLSNNKSSTSLMGKSMDEAVKESLAKMNDTSESAVDEAQEKGGCDRVRT